MQPQEVTGSQIERMNAPSRTLAGQCPRDLHSGRWGTEATKGELVHFNQDSTLLLLCIYPFSKYDHLPNVLSRC